MAIVPNKDGQGIKANGFVGDVDPSYSSPTASGAAFPTGAAQYTGQLYRNTTTGEVTRNIGGSNWIESNWP